MVKDRGVASWRRVEGGEMSWAVMVFKNLFTIPALRPWLFSSPTLSASRIE